MRKRNFLWALLTVKMLFLWNIYWIMLLGSYFIAIFFSGSFLVSRILVFCNTSVGLAVTRFCLYYLLLFFMILVEYIMGFICLLVSGWMQV